MNNFLFAYGTLNDPEVQQYVFQRILEGEEDLLPCYRISNKKLYGRYLVLEHTGNEGDTISGCIYRVDSRELVKADVYEGPAYNRINVVLGSGREAWVYVERLTKKPGNEL